MLQRQLAFERVSVAIAVSPARAAVATLGIGREQRRVAAVEVVDLLPQLDNRTLMLVSRRPAGLGSTEAAGVEGRTCGVVRAVGCLRRGVLPPERRKLVLELPVFGSHLSELRARVRVDGDVGGATRVQIWLGAGAGATHVCSVCAGAHAGLGAVRVGRPGVLCAGVVAAVLSAASVGVAPVLAVQGEAALARRLSLEGAHGAAEHLVVI